MEKNNRIFGDIEIGSNFLLEKVLFLALYDGPHFQKSLKITLFRISNNWVACMMEFCKG